MLIKYYPKKGFKNVLGLRIVVSEISGGKKHGNKGNCGSDTSKSEGKQLEREAGSNYAGPLDHFRIWSPQSPETLSKEI